MTPQSTHGVRDLFNRRFKGFRIVELGAVACLSVMILGVYAFKAGAGREGSQITDVQTQIGEEAKHVRLLKAELAHLEQPDRLTRLATAYLGLGPEDARREAPVDSLPELSKHLAGPPDAASSPTQRSAGR